MWAYHEQNVYRQLNSLTSDRMSHGASFQQENVNQQHHDRTVVRFEEIVDSNGVPNLKKPSYIYCLYVLGSVGYLGIDEYECLTRDCCWAPSEKNVSILLGISYNPQQVLCYAHVPNHMQGEPWCFAPSSD